MPKNRFRLSKSRTVSWLKVEKTKEAAGFSPPGLNFRNELNLLMFPGKSKTLFDSGQANKGERVNKRMIHIFSWFNSDTLDNSVILSIANGLRVSDTSV